MLKISLQSNFFFCSLSFFILNLTWSIVLHRDFFSLLCIHTLIPNVCTFRSPVNKLIQIIISVTLALSKLSFSILFCHFVIFLILSFIFFLFFFDLIIIFISKQQNHKPSWWESHLSQGNKDRKKQDQALKLGLLVWKQIPKRLSLTYSLRYCWTWAIHLLLIFWSGWNVKTSCR
jgi:hypothetical protein